MSSAGKTSISALTLVVGEDDYLVGTRAREIVDAVIPADEQMTALDIVESNASNADEAEACVSKCRAALSSSGLFSEKRLVWLRGASFIGGSRVSQSASAKTAVSSLLDLLKKGLMPGMHLLVSADKVDKRSAFYKYFDSSGTIHEFASAKPYEQDRDAADFVSVRLKELGLSMDDKAMSLFVEKAGTSTRILAMELEKLDLYAGTRRVVTADDIDVITSSARSAEAWDIADAFGEKDIVRSLKILGRLLYQSESEVGIIMAIEARIRELLVYRDAIDSGWIRKGGRGWFEWGSLPDSVDRVFSGDGVKDPRSTHPYRVNILAGQAMKFTVPELKAMLRIAVKAHEGLVSGGDSKRNILESLIVRLLRNRKRAAR